MGYTTNGPNKATHDALIARQDAELRLLDLMKRCLSAKIKSDRDYATALSSVSIQGQKVDKCEELTNSIVASAWKTMMEELENTSKLIKQNAEALETRALSRLSSLLIERRKARKSYQEDHNRFSQQFSQISEEVGRKQTDYQKCLESYRQMRTKFEENYLKCPTSRGSKKLDGTCEKYCKACKRLHRSHNEYVLLLAEAGECERVLRTTALPALSEHQRRQGEAFITTLRGILLDIVQMSDLNSDKYRDIQMKITNTFQGLKPQDEYRDFTKFITPPSSPVLFRFDEKLIDDTPGRLLPNQLIVDNLTVDILKEKLTELEGQLQDNKDKQIALQGPEIIGNGICKNNNTSIITNGTDRNSPTPCLPQNSSDPIKLLELRILERKWTKQVEIIKCALSDLGGEEIPNGCPELGVAPDSLETEVVNNEQDRSSVSSKTSLILKSTAIPLFKILTKPFRRRSLPPSPALPPKNRAFRSGSEGPFMLNGVGAVERPLEEEEWFHGVLPREEVVRLLRADGDYLVRETTRNLEKQTVLSVCWGGHKHFIVQTTPEGQYRFEGASFPSVRELIAWQRSSGSPVTAKSGAILRRAVPKERWELNNDDVELLEEIGRGNFSDVYRARLKSTNQIVAVKSCRITLPEEQKKTFLQEGRILKQYDHPNIVRLIGICVQKQPIMIVMEHVSGGSLLNFLRKYASSSMLNERTMLGLCRDAAAGMSYLESRHCIHRDLAARNCLVGNDNIVKISDFGMSREEKEYIVSKGMKQIPIKWTAPEALNFGKYTSLCDVWSFGVLMWEIFSKGDVPYSGLSNSRAREKIDAGYRMPAPDGCTNDIYSLMLKCWDYDPEKRPHFEQIYNILDNLYLAR